MIVGDVAVILVIAGVILAGILDDWSGIPVAVGAPLLGISILAFSTLGPVEGAAALATGGGVVAIIAGEEIRRYQQIRHAFRLRWFDLSATVLAVVGALELALQRPLFGTAAVGIVGNVLFFSGLLHSVTGRPARLSSGVLFLISAGALMYENDGQVISRGQILLLDVLQIVLAFALTFLFFAEKRTLPHDSNTEEEESSAPPDDTLTTPAVSTTDVLR
ncbi:MAG TPA: hypothetical protein VKX96_14965 [Chloroflexota bacterium]|nr:hypothetical protein [Chloroflexota bacterium]